MQQDVFAGVVGRAAVSYTTVPLVKNILDRCLLDGYDVCSVRISCSCGN